MFEIYFQSGEFLSEASSSSWDFVKDLLVQIIGTTVGAGLAFIIYRIQTKDQNIDKDQQKDDTLEFFHHLIIESLKTTDFIEKGLTNSVKLLAEIPLEVPNFQVAASEDLRRLVFDVNRQEIYLAFRNKVAEGNIQIIFNCIDSAYSLINNIKEIWNRSSNKITAKKNVVNELVNQILNEMSKVNIDKTVNKDDRTSLQRIIYRYLLIPKHEPDYLELDNELLIPIIEFFSDDAGDEKLRIFILRQYADECHRKIGELFGDAANLKNNMENASSTLKDINMTFKKQSGGLKVYVQDSMKDQTKERGWKQKIKNLF